MSILSSIAGSSKKLMIIMRGISGSGKTHLVREFNDSRPDVCVVSADDYFMRDGASEPCQVTGSVAGAFLRPQHKRNHNG